MGCAAQAGDAERRRFDFFSVEGVYDIQGEMTGLYRVLGRQGDYQLAMADCGA